MGCGTSKPPSSASYRDVQLITGGGRPRGTSVLYFRHRVHAGRTTDLPQASWKNAQEPLMLLTYLPQKSKDFFYSNTHRVYTNDIARAKNLPPPHPTPTRRREIFNPKTYARVDKKTESFLNTDLVNPITELVHKLTDGYADDLSKVRALYRWLTAQPVETTPYNKTKPYSTMYQLYHLQKKHINYADVFSVLCWFADVPCVIIRGYLKGSTYEVGQALDKNLHEGEWNAVLIGQHWRFINAFWGSCILTDEGYGKSNKYIYQQAENYFLTDPEELIYSHFPEDDAWQLLIKPKTLEEFESMAFVKELFFDFKMEIVSHEHCVIVAKDGRVNIIFQLHPFESTKQSFLCVPSYFGDKGTKKNAKREPFKKDSVQVDIQQRGKRKELSIKVNFPEAGTYKLDIIGKDVTNDSPRNYYDWVAIYKVIVNNVPDVEKKEMIPSPRNLEAVGFGPGENLQAAGLSAESPTDGYIEMAPGVFYMEFGIADPVKFKSAHLTAIVYLFGDTDEKQLAQTQFKQTGKTLKAAVPITEGQFRVGITYKTKQDGKINICNYKVNCVRPPTPKKKTPEPKQAKQQNTLNELRTQLNDAIDAQDIQLLEKAVDDTESKGFTKELEPELKQAKQLLVKLHRFQKVIGEVMSMDQRAIAEIKSYAHPIPEIHTVMKATMLLLGNSEEETKEWANIKILIGKTGKLSLKRRIKELDMENLSEDAVNRSKALLQGIELKDIVQYSVGVATFYSWSMEVTARASETK